MTKVMCQHDSGAPKVHSCELTGSWIIPPSFSLRHQRPSINSCPASDADASPESNVSSKQGLAQRQLVAPELDHLQGHMDWSPPHGMFDSSCLLPAASRAKMQFGQSARATIASWDGSACCKRTFTKWKACKSGRNSHPVFAARGHHGAVRAPVHSIHLIGMPRQIHLQLLAAHIPHLQAETRPNFENETHLGGIRGKEVFLVGRYATASASSPPSQRCRVASPLAPDRQQHVEEAIWQRNGNVQLEAQSSPSRNVTTPSRYNAGTHRCQPKVDPAQKVLCCPAKALIVSLLTELLHVLLPAFEREK